MGATFSRGVHEGGSLFYSVIGYSLILIQRKQSPIVLERQPGNRESSWAARLKWIFYGPTVIVLLAFILRLGITIGTHSYKLPSADDHWKFAGEIGRVARNLAVGRGFSAPYTPGSGPTALVSPIYAYFLAGLFRVFGTYSDAAALAAIIFNSLCSALTCWTIFLLGSRTLSERVGFAAAWIWSLSPFAVHASVQYIWETALSTFLLSLAFALTPETIEEGSRNKWVMYGGLWGLIALTNASLVTSLPFLLVWSAYRQRFGRAHLFRIGLGLVTALVVVSPWIIRNRVVFHQGIFLRSGMGAELYEATLLDQEYGRSHPFGILPDDATEQAIYAQTGERRFMERKSALAKAWISEHPIHFLKLCGERFLFFWTGTWTETHEYGIRGMFLRFVPYALFSALGLIGLYAVFRNKEKYAVLYLIPLAVHPLIYYVTHVEARYRVPIEPFLAILSAYAIYCGYSRREASSSQRRLIASGS